jgi:gas vesicle protein
MSSNRRAIHKPAAVLVGVLSVALGSASAATDLASIQVVPTRGQSPDQARRDRYECHNWAVEQTGSAPVRVDPGEEAAVERERDIQRVLTGAGIGSTVGAIVGAYDEDPITSIVGGGVLGAAVAAITGRGKSKETPDPAAKEYLRALSACLEARGYEIVVPSESEEASEEA